MSDTTFAERETEESTDVSEEVVDEGVQLINEFFEEWLGREQRRNDGDVEMTDESEESIRRLKEQVEKFAPRLEGNLWLRNVIASL